MMYPLRFEPRLKERVWGGRNLESLYGKSLPPSVPIGESWEITDRPGDVSVILNGPWKGRDLRWLMSEHREELLGKAARNERFPLLIKILDAQETLSLQVHPPASVAPRLGGEAKTEMWYVAEANPGAQLYAGLKRGVTRVEFERRIQDGSIADCFHRVPVRAGDSMFVPSGRVHALGGGTVIFEVQQNSDTTYRVFDWNRKDAHGNGRELHVTQSLQSIDFSDFEPGLIAAEPHEENGIITKALTRDPLFQIDHCIVTSTGPFGVSPGVMEILAVLSGGFSVSSAVESFALRAGEFCLFPAGLKPDDAQLSGQGELLRIRCGAPD
jgi:mannose-6-phosphate isomerase